MILWQFAVLRISSGRAAGFGIGIAFHASVRLAVPGRRHGSSGRSGGAVIAHMFLLGAVDTVETAHLGDRAARAVIR